ncbi:MAG TPA: ABC transporter permease [Micrococcales bacterium]|uniref:ABC transporter permease n=1 Tax=Miniimonas arenae TaxID=676201 RepID=UPI000EC09038|nr:ABC transporter permease [Miniimonas arenae]HCX85246.1 ABC transporter permease [Micrococcales bacterium]
MTDPNERDPRDPRQSDPASIVPGPESASATPSGGTVGLEPSVPTVLDPAEGLPPTSPERSYSQGQLVRRRFLRHRGAMIGLVVLVLIALLAFTSIGIGPIPGWWGKDFRTTGPTIDGGRPTLGFFHVGEHPFGQDTVGRDFFALTMRGTQISLIIAFVVGIGSTIIGTVVGGLAGYFRGWIEALLMRLTDLLIIIPLLVLAAVIARGAGDAGILTLAVVLAAVTWTSLARLVRGEVLSLREREFVTAARAIGTSPARIIVQHILPNTIGVIIVSTTFTIASAILLETSLSFLGFGVQPPDVSLGSLISQYQTAFTVRPWLFWFPGLFILAIALCVNFIGDGLRDAFDPRQNRNGE